MFKSDLLKKLDAISIDIDDLWQYSFDKPKLQEVKNLLADALDNLEQCHDIVEDL